MGNFRSIMARMLFSCFFATLPSLPKCVLFYKNADDLSFQPNNESSLPQRYEWTQHQDQYTLHQLHVHCGYPSTMTSNLTYSLAGRLFDGYELWNQTKTCSFQKCRLKIQPLSHCQPWGHASLSVYQILFSIESEQKTHICQKSSSDIMNDHHAYFNFLYSCTCI